MLVGLPVASSPLATTWMPAPAAEIVIVLPFGAGPGTYLDLARLSFQVPIAGSLCAEMVQDAPTTRAATTTAPRMRPLVTLI